MEGVTNVAADAAADTFPKLLREHARVRGNRTAMRHKDRGIWQSWTWAAVYENVRALAFALGRLGVTHGAKVAIVASNRPLSYWTVTATQWLGAVPVPVYADAIADELAYVLENADVIVALAQDQEQVDKILSVIDRLPALKAIVYDERRGLEEYTQPYLFDLNKLMAEAAEALATDPHAASAHTALIDAGRGEWPSIMLYTSGTTGRSKGVVLTGARSIAAARDTVAFDHLDADDIQLAYLPLAWVGDHYMNYAQGMVAGFCTACPESPDTVAQDLCEIGPTFYFAPPRVFESLLTRVLIRMEDASGLKRALFHHFIDVARRWGEKILNKEPVSIGARLYYALGELLIYGPLKNALGFSRIRIAYTAGEAIGADLFSFYRSIGLNLKQLYGQTEAFLYVTCHADGAIRPDTVGAPAPNVAIRISDEGEVQFKSPGQFLAYYKDETKTAEALTEDGYIKTGDAGFFEPDGQLRIIDRAKDVGKLANGALFAPKYIENKLKFFPNIKEAVAFGDKREFVTVMLNIDLTSVGNWAERNNISYASYQELAAHPLVYDMLAKHVDDVNRALSADPMMAQAQIQRFLVLHKELDADDGEMTRTQKVRRGFIAERYAPLVDALYNGAEESHISTIVTFEDGRKATLSATVKIRDAITYPQADRERAA